MITFKKGNIFTTKCQTIVNTVNCVGVMGAGIAFEFKLRTPIMFEKYQKHCENGLINTGKLWVYNDNNNELGSAYDKVLNFPTKHHWKYPTKMEYLEKGLQKFLDTYQEKGITSIAFPLLGADKGGIPQEQSLSVMQHYLEQCEIPVEIWRFDPTAKDDLYDRFKQLMIGMTDEQIKEQSKLRIDGIKKLKLALMKDDVNSLSGLLRQRGIGDVTLQKAFTLLKCNKDSEETPQLAGF